MLEDFGGAGERSMLSQRRRAESGDEEKGEERRRGGDDEEVHVKRGESPGGQVSENSAGGKKEVNIST